MSMPAAHNPHTTIPDYGHSVFFLPDINTQCSPFRILRMLLSIPLVIISTLGVISFLGTSFLFSRLSSSLLSSLAGSSPERISSYGDQTFPTRYSHPSHHVESGAIHTRHRDPYPYQRTRRSTSNTFMSNIIDSLVRSLLSWKIVWLTFTFQDCPEQLSCEVYKLSQSQDLPIISSIIRPLLHQRNIDIYDKLSCSDVKC